MPKQKLKPRADGRLQKAVTDPRTGKRVFFYGATEREINKKILEYTEKAEKGRIRNKMNYLISALYQAVKAKGG